MAKRGRKGKSTGFLGTSDPKVAREIIGVVILLISIILILSEFGLAGKFGVTIFAGLKDFFGIVAYFVPAWLAFATVMFLKSEITTTTKKFFWGLFIFLILLSALVAPFGDSGGRLGGAIFGTLASIAGEIASLFIIIAALLITVILMFNL